MMLNALLEPQNDTVSVEWESCDEAVNHPMNKVEEFHPKDP